MIPPPSKARKWWNMFDLYTLFFLQTRQRKWRVRRFGGHMQILDGCGPINYSHVTSEYANIRPSQLAKCLANKTSLGDRLRWSPRLSSMSPATNFFPRRWNFRPDSTGQFHTSTVQSSCLPPVNPNYFKLVYVFSFLWLNFRSHSFCYRSNFSSTLTFSVNL